MSSNEVVAGWVNLQTITGGWVVFCRLCGKRTRREFHGSQTNYAEALQAAEDYQSEHAGSEMHEVALKAFHAPEVAAEEFTKEEMLLRAIFGDSGPPKSEYQVRRSAAKRAANVYARQH